MCSSNNIATPACANGLCTGACNMGWADCDGNRLMNGCECNTATHGCVGQTCLLLKGQACTANGDCVSNVCNVMTMTCN